METCGLKNIEDKDFPEIERHKKKYNYETYYKKYYEENKERILESQKKYYQKNRERILHNSKQYNESNKEAIAKWRHEYDQRPDIKAKKAARRQELTMENPGRKKEANRIYFENNREMIRAKRKEKVECECGIMIAKESLSKHRLSKKHQREYL